MQRSMQSQNEISHEEYVVFPVKLINLYLQILGFALIGAGIICLTAFNWLYLTSMQKLMMAEVGLLITFIAGLMLKKVLHKEICFALFSVIIGCFWAIFGQIYQINSSLYHYPLVWFISLLPFAIILRLRFTTLLTAVLLYAFIILYIKAQFHYWYSVDIISISALLLTSTVLSFTFILLSQRNICGFSIVGGYIFFAMTVITFFYWGLALYSDLSYLIFLPLMIAISSAYIFTYCITQQKAMMIIIYLMGTGFVFISLLFKMSFNNHGGEIFLAWSIYAIIIAFPIYKGAMVLLELVTKAQNIKEQDHE